MTTSVAREIVKIGPGETIFTGTKYKNTDPITYLAKNRGLFKFRKQLKSKTVFNRYQIGNFPYNIKEIYYRHQEEGKKGDDNVSYLLLCRLIPDKSKLDIYLCMEAENKYQYYELPKIQTEDGEWVKQENDIDEGIKITLYDNYEELMRLSPQKNNSGTAIRGATKGSVLALNMA